jgi:hypothetical protein
LLVDAIEQQLEVGSTALQVADGVGLQEIDCV